MKAKIIDVKKIVKSQKGGDGPSGGTPPKNIEGWDEEETGDETGEGEGGDEGDDSGSGEDDGKGKGSQEGGDESSGEGSGEKIYEWLVKSGAKTPKPDQPGPSDEPDAQIMVGDIIRDTKTNTYGKVKSVDINTGEIEYDPINKEDVSKYL